MKCCPQLTKSHAINFSVKTPATLNILTNCPLRFFGQVHPEFSVSVQNFHFYALLLLACVYKVFFGAVA